MEQSTRLQMAFSLQKKIMMLEQILSISNGKNKIEIPKPSVLNPVNPEAIMGLIPSGTRTDRIETCQWWD